MDIIEHIMNKSYYTLGAPSWFPGFFSCYQVVVGFLDYCENTNPLGYRVKFEKGLYFDSSVGNNWWEYYFEPINNGNYSEEHNKNICDSLKSQWAIDAISSISRNRACKIITKYIKLKSHIKQKIDNFKSINWNSSHIIGVHYRGTDKSSESIPCSYEHVKNVIKNYYIDNKSKIFVATDENEFVHYLISIFGFKNVCFYDSIRSYNNSIPIHHIPEKNGGENQVLNNRYKLGEDVVIDCYLLSMTDILLKTQSNVSSSACNINPNLQYIDMNEPRKNFKEKNIR
jgi:hypothetical protein